MSLNAEIKFMLLLFKKKKKKRTTDFVSAGSLVLTADHILSQVPDAPGRELDRSDHPPLSNPREAWHYSGGLRVTVKTGSGFPQTSIRLLESPPGGTPP